MVSTGSGGASIERQCAPRLISEGGLSHATDGRGSGCCFVVALLQFFTEQRMDYAFKTGNELLENCSAPPSSGPYVACFSYISGVADTLSMMNIACTSPLGGNERQMTDLVANRLRAHPEIRHYAAAGEVLLALKDSFPCR